MPQFDFAHVFWPQLAWLAISFALLYFGVVRLTLPKLGKVMDARDNKIAGDIAEAKAAKANADAIDARYHADMAMSRDEARNAIALAKAAAAKSTEARLAVAAQQAEAEIAAAEARIAEAVTKAEGTLRDAAAESAADIVAKLTGKQPKPDAAQAAVAALV